MAAWRVGRQQLLLLLPLLQQPLAGSGCTGRSLRPGQQLLSVVVVVLLLLADSGHTGRSGCSLWSSGMGGMG